MDYSPKLRTAIAEIKQILKKHDIAGVVVLHDKTGHGEYLNEITPSYSCLNIAANGEVRLQARLKDFDGNKLKMRQKITATANMTQVLADLVGLCGFNFFKINDIVSKALGAISDEGKHTDSSEIDN